MGHDINQSLGSGMCQNTTLRPSDSNANHEYWLARNKRLFGETFCTEQVRKAVDAVAAKIGDPDDSGVYVGKSATDGRDLHAALADEPEYLTFDEALAAAERLKAEHPTAHVPTPDELDKNLFANRDKGALKDTFNTSGYHHGTVYRSAAPDGFFKAPVQFFDDGVKLRLFNKETPHAVRLVW